MDPAGIVEDKVDTIMSTDGQTDLQTRWNQYTHLQLGWSSGYNNSGSDCYLITLEGTINSMKPTDNTNPIVMALICHSITMI